MAQYRNTLRDLFGLEEIQSDAPPPDGISNDGFANNGRAMVMSPLRVGSYFDIAEKALDLCIVDDSMKPVIQSFRMDFGPSIRRQTSRDSGTTMTRS